MILCSLIYRICLLCVCEMYRLVVSWHSMRWKCRSCSKVYRITIWIHFCPFFLFNRQTTLEPMNITISRIKMSDYEQHHYDKDTLKQNATPLGSIEVNPTSDLEAVRVLINRMCDEANDSPKLTADWCFIDCKCQSIFASIRKFSTNSRDFSCLTRMLTRR